MPDTAQRTGTESPRLIAHLYEFPEHDWDRDETRCLRCNNDATRLAKQVLEPAIGQRLSWKKCLVVTEVIPKEEERI